MRWVYAPSTVDDNPHLPAYRALARSPRDAEGARVIYDEHFACDPKNMARGSGRTPGQMAPALHTLAARNRMRVRGVIDAAAEARMAGRAEASIADLFRAAVMRVMPARKGARVPRFEVVKQLTAAGAFLWRNGAATDWPPCRACRAIHATRKTFTPAPTITHRKRPAT